MHARGWRASGGVGFYVRDCIAARFEVYIHPKIHHAIEKQGQDFAGPGEHCLFIVLVYLPLKGLFSESHCDALPVFKLLQQDIICVLRVKAHQSLLET